MSVREIMDVNELQVLKQKYYSVFIDIDPFKEMFLEIVEEKIIICPINDFYLEEEQFNPLLQAASIVSDTSFYISELESPTAFSTPKGHWESSLSLQYNKYEELDIVLENALYSVNGKWGVLISHEDHAVIGGTKLFMDTFKHAYPDWMKGVNNFKEMWDYNKLQFKSNTEWIPNYLKYFTN